MQNLEEIIKAYDEMVTRIISWPGVMLENDDSAKIAISADGEKISVTTWYAESDYGGGYCDEKDSKWVDAKIFLLPETEFQEARMQAKKEQEAEWTAKMAAARAAKENEEKAEFERLKAKFAQ